MKTRPVYLDYAAHCPLRDSARKHLADFLRSDPGNPSSLHQAGRNSALLLADARDRIAANLHAETGEILFTSSGTEAVNLAILGLARAHRSRGRHILTSQVEHPATKKALAALESEGWEITSLATDAHGYLPQDDVLSACRKDTVLVSLIWANNELGTLSPAGGLGPALRSQGILLHLDAVQVIPSQSIHVTQLGADALSFSAAKIGGLAGTGLLWLRKGTPLAPTQFGGFQEGGLRPGTQNLAGIRAFAAAWEELEANRVIESTRLKEKRSFLVEQLEKSSGVRINTHSLAHVDHILNFSVENVDGESLFMKLDMGGVNVSNGSACSSGSLQPSPVLLAVGLDPDLARATVRVSWGWNTRTEEMERFTQLLNRILEGARA